MPINKIKNNDIHKILQACIEKCKKLQAITEMTPQAEKDFVTEMQHQFRRYKLTKSFITQNLAFFKQYHLEDSIKKTVSGYAFNHKNVYTNLSISKSQIDAITYEPVKQLLSEMINKTPIESFITAGLEAFFNIHFRPNTPIKETDFVMHLANDLIKSYEIFKYDSLISEKQKQIRLLETILKETKNLPLLDAKLRKIEKKINREDYQVPISAEDTLHLGQQLLEWLIESKLVQSELITLKGQKKEAYIIKPSEHLWSCITSSWVKAENLPLLCPPNDWALAEEPENQITNAFGGGLLKNEFSAKLQSLVLPSQRLYIKDPDNKKRLIIRTPDCGITTYVSEKSLNIINYMQKIPFKINTKLLNYIMKNITLYFDHEQISIYKFEGAEDYVTKQGKPKKNDLAEYNSELNKVRYILDCLFTAEAYKNQKIYFIKALDFRNRIYSVGFPISPMSDILGRSLLLLDGEGQDVSLDVTASGFQILGLLLGDEKLLEKTKIFKSDDPLDLYTDFRKKLLEKKFPTLIDAKKTYEETEEFLIDRALIKNIIMCHSYNESLYGLIEKLKDKDFFSLELKKHNITIREFATTTKNFIEEEQPLIAQFSKIMEKLVKANGDKPFGFNRSFYNHTTVYYTKEIKVRIPSKIPEKIKKRTTLLVEKSPISIDLRKSVRAMVPNYVHFQDSMILMKTIEDLQKKNIPLTSSHDSIRTKPEFIQETKLAYLAACIEIYLLPEKKPLQELIEMHMPFAPGHDEIHEFIETINNNLETVSKRAVVETNLNVDGVLNLEKDKFLVVGCLRKRA